MNRLFSATLATGAAFALQAADLDFVREVKPILELHCVSCHGGEQKKGGLKLDTKENAFKGGDSGATIISGKPDESSLYTTTILPADHELAMPPKGDRLPREQTDALKNWIAQGAAWPEGVTLKAVKKIDFVKDIQPILEFSCVSCHQAGHDKGGLRLDTRDLAFKGGDSGPTIIPGKSKESSLYTLTTLPADHDDLMPPAKKGGPLPKEQQEMLRDWIDQGANWPAGITLSARRTTASAADDPALVQEIYEKIIANLSVTNEADMKPFKITIPGSEVTFEMIPIPGGEFLMGSPASEPGRKSDEGPQHKVKIAPFWMGKCEVTWNEYELFQFPDEEKKKRLRLKSDPSLHLTADAVARPTTPYVEMSFGMGKDGFPAISMTQHAANTYCKWLSAKVGRFFRLPTEAEWEYACRAGTTTAWSFGDDPAKIGEYAWFANNSDWKYQKVGTKKPNPWGLHDMHGNVLEWCLDQYSPDTYQEFASVTAENPWLRATKPYPHVARGGSWDDEPDKLRSAARRASDKTWKIQDPQLPKSIWYHTDAQFLGFRIVMPLNVVPPDQLSKYWTSGVERD
ncbi:MAG: SUMF1/EgtB/PvdO family nonheme iron enzyme [Verrucomicrobiota bacterium]|nr:SUMF1/EgtB/PvdO family nonheme iron enzyme [Verrucomicrobiota bacterium]